MSNESNDRYSQIVQAAIKLFRQKSYHGTSMNDIADEVGLYRGSLYHYINSKEELLFHIVEQAVSRINQEIVKVQAEDISATEKIRKAIYHHVNTLVKHLPEHSIMMEDTKQLPQVHQEKIRTVQKQYEEIFQGIILEGVRKDEFKEMHPKVTFAILGMMNWIYRWYSAEGQLAPEEVAHLFEELILHGLSKTNCFDSFQ